MDDRSFGFGLPQIVTSADAIVGSNQRDVSVTVAGGAGDVVSAYDDASVTVETAKREGEPLGRTTIAEGSRSSPTSPPPRRRSPRRCRSPAAARARPPTTPPARRASGSATRQSCGAGHPRGGWRGGVLPGARGRQRRGAGRVRGAADRNGASRSRRGRRGRHRAAATRQRKGQPTAHGVLPHQLDRSDTGTTVRSGPSLPSTAELTLCPGNTRRGRLPGSRPRPSLDLSGLGEDQRSELATRVARGRRGAADVPADTYFGGKHAYRAAQLLSIAEPGGGR